MQWSGLEQSGIPPAVVGYNYPLDAASGYFNHPFSGLSIANLIACSNMVNNTEWTTLAYKISLSASDILLLRQQCREMHDLEIAQQSTIDVLAATARPCPCSLRQAVLDRRYTFSSYGSSSSEVVCYFGRFDRGGLNLCCYSM